MDNSLTGEECLKNNLAYLAEGEEFFWYEHHNIETVEGKKINLSSPPDYILKDIQAFCNSINIELILEDT